MGETKKRIRQLVDLIDRAKEALDNVSTIANELNDRLNADKLADPPALRSPTWELRELLAGGLAPSQIAALKRSDVLKTDAEGRARLNVPRCGRFPAQRNMRLSFSATSAVFSLLHVGTVNMIDRPDGPLVVDPETGEGMTARAVRYWANERKGA
jgi:hypothetical protein